MAHPPLPGAGLEAMQAARDVESGPKRRGAFVDPAAVRAHVRRSFPGFMLMVRMHRLSSERKVNLYYRPGKYPEGEVLAFPLRVVETAPGHASSSSDVRPPS
jgi:hypothetical protein